MKISDNQIQSYEQVFNIENLLRLSINSYLKINVSNDFFNSVTFPKYKDKWIDGRGNDIDIVNNVKQIVIREQTEMENDKISTKVFYLHYKILISMIDNYWDDHFNNMFKKGCDKKHLIDKLKATVKYRNDVAHNRPISNNANSNFGVAFQCLIENLKTEYFAEYEGYINYLNKSTISDINLKIKDIKNKLQSYNPIHSSDIKEIMQLIRISELNEFDEIRRNILNSISNKIKTIAEVLTGKYNPAILDDKSREKATLICQENDIDKLLTEIQKKL